MTETEILRLGYARVSTLNDEQTTSIESQQQRLKAYGCHEIYADRASGGKGDREGWLALMDKAISVQGGQEVEVVYCDQSRFARDLHWFMGTVMQLVGAGVKVYDLSSQKHVNPDDPIEWMVNQLTGSVHEFQRKETRRKVREAMERIRAKQGRVGGKAPLGYLWNESNTALQPNPEQWELARAIVDRFLAGEQLNTLSRWLKGQGVNFTAAGLTEWLKNEKLRGNLHYRYGKGRKESHTAYGTHQALITLAESRAIHQRLEQNRSHPRDRRILAVSSLCRCISCNRILQQSSRRKKNSITYYWRCRGKTTQLTKCPNSGIIPHRVIEPAILEVICKKAEVIAHCLTEPPARTISPEALRLESELAKLEDFYRQYPRDGLRRDIEQLRAQLAHLRSQDYQEQQHSGELREWVALLAEPTFWDGMGEDERNHIYRDLGIVVWCRGRTILRIDCQL